MSCDYRRAFGLIEAMLDATPGATLRAMSAKLRLHPDTTAAIIRQVTGKSASAWRQEAVAARARQVLREHPTVSVKEVAAGVNLTSNGLRRLLLRQFRLTPTQIRTGETPS